MFQIRPLAFNLSKRQKARSAIRCIKTADVGVAQLADWSQKARSAIRCIKTKGFECLHLPMGRRQKAPSAIRCIKTRLGFCPSRGVPFVRKHQAP